MPRRLHETTLRAGGRAPCSRPHGPGQESQRSRGAPGRQFLWSVTCGERPLRGRGRGGTRLQREARQVAGAPRRRPGNPRRADPRRRRRRGRHRARERPGARRYREYCHSRRSRRRCRCRRRRRYGRRQQMSTISVVTAVDPRRADHLATTWNSLACQVMPPGWSWEWLVQCDSTDPADQQAVRQHLPDDPRISFAASRHGGPAIARTMTLARARGRLVKTLDADDRLTGGALARDIEAHSNPGVLWSASRVVDEYPDGRRENHFPWDPPGGPIRSGTACAAYKQGWRILVHPATLCIRSPILLALGGWMALPASEDTALLMALDACGDGFFIPEPGMIYRRWSPQMSASAQHVEPYELGARRTLVLHRAQAISDWVAGRSNEVPVGVDFPVRTR